MQPTLLLRMSIASALLVLLISTPTSIAAGTQTPVGPPRTKTGEAPSSGGPTAGLEDGGLPRRARVGLTVAESAAGIVVQSVVPRSAAASAGIRQGDVIANVNGTSIRTSSAFSERLRTMHAGESYDVTLVRGEESVQVRLVPDEALREGDFDSKTEYSALAGSGGRLRSLTTIPSRLGAARAPGVLVIRGVGAGASDAPGNNPFRELAIALAKQGVVTMRYDLSGVGDSEGPLDATVDFNVEVADARAALAQLRSDPRVDPDRIVLVGQGTGGGVAAVVASADRKLAGLVVIGMIARPLIEYLLDSRRQQMLLAAVPAGDVDDVLRQHISIYAQILENDATPQPDELGIVASDGTLMGKGAAFWKQYDQVNFGRVFAELTMPVMNAIGEFDFVSTLADHRAIAEALRGHADPSQLIIILDRTDHDLRSFDSREAAFAGFGTDAPVNERAISAIASWVREKIQRPAA